MKSLSATSHYFEDIYQRLVMLESFLDSDKNNLTLLTYREEIHTMKILIRMSNWCRLCLMRYLHVFWGGKGPRALQNCLNVWKYCLKFSNLLRNIEMDENEFNLMFEESVMLTIKKSVFDFEFPRLVELYKDNQELPASNPVSPQNSNIINDNKTNNTKYQNQKNSDISQNKSETNSLNSNLDSKHLSQTSGGSHMTADSNDTYVVPISYDENKSAALRKKILKKQGSLHPRLRSDTGLAKISQVIMKEGGGYSIDGNYNASLDNSIHSIDNNKKGFQKMAKNQMRRISNFKKNINKAAKNKSKKVKSKSLKKMKTPQLEPVLQSIDEPITSISIGYQKSANEIISEESPVADAVQLIMVIKGCEKYLALDESEYGASFKQYCPNFNLVETTAEQYLQLAFSFANIYLRVVANSLEEKLEEQSEYLLSKIVTNKPSNFELDDNVWSLYQELKRFYEILKKYFKFSFMYICLCSLYVFVFLIRF